MSARKIFKKMRLLSSEIRTPDRAKIKSRYFFAILPNSNANFQIFLEFFFRICALALQNRQGAGIFAARGRNFVLPARGRLSLWVEIMSSLLKALKFAREKPAGCSFAFALSLAMMCAVAAGALWLFFAFAGVRAFRDSVASATGFYPIYENAYLNVFTGEFSIDRLTLFNPPAYKRASGGDGRDRAFIKAENVKMRVCPLSLFRGKLAISSFSAEVESLNCLRINQSDYNFGEFIGGISEILEICPDSSGAKVLSGFSLKISKAEYEDLSSGKNSLAMRISKPFSFSDFQVEDFGRFFSKMEEAFSDRQAPFISKALKEFLGK